MLLNLDFKIKELSGKEIEADSAAKLLAGVLARKGEGFSPIKSVDFAYKLYNSGEIEIDRADLDILSNIVEKCDFFDLVKAQILEKINLIKLEK